jgi:hypothetical protein
MEDPEATGKKPEFRVFTGAVGAPFHCRAGYHIYSRH